MAKNNTPKAVKTEKNAKNTATSTKKTTKKKKKVKVSHIVKPAEMTLEEWQIKLRKQVTETEHFNISCVDDELCPGEYIVRNPEKNNEYKVVYRGANSEWNYCSCMDFKTSKLGTCKHLEAVKKWFSGKRGLHVHRELPPYTSVYLSYRDERCVKIRIGSENKEAYEKLAKDYFDEKHVLKKAAYAHIGSFLKQARQISDTFRCYKDAIDFIIDKREKSTREKIVKTYDDKKLDNLLKVKLYPYQKEGIRFAAKAGKAIIADEMGLGKTIQAIGTAELLRKEGLIGSVLILCPTSLKYQWRSEIKKFTDAEVFVIEGNHLKRKDTYNRPEPYKIISYNSAANDIKILGSLQTDMLIMDEVQRLKNWNTQISRAARKIESDYSVILSGTPLENKLDELYSIVEFVDNFRLAPYYIFKENHIITDETGKVLGYKNLNKIGEKLNDILIRRRKKDVKLQMPKRMDKNLFVPMTKEQMGMHAEWQFQVSFLVKRWRAHHFLSDKDRKRLLLLLSQMRMVCDSSYILDQKTRFDTKVDECINIISDIISEEGEKVVVFSQWERMTRLIAKELEKKEIGYEYLHGGVPSEKRKNLVDNFMNEPSSRVFLSTDAGSTGLNLQSAATIINIDLPWNPAVLEQRIGRIYRLGQQNNIQVINLVTPHSIEEEMLGKLRFKTSMFEGVLDDGEDSIFISDDKFTKMMEAVSGIMEEVKTENKEDWTNQDITEEGEEKNNKANTPEVKAEPDKFKDISSIAPHSATTVTHRPAEPKDLVAQGVSFLSGLAETLKSPEATAQLVDSIIEKDEQTGETSIKIPVESKETVSNLLNLIGKLFAK
jgi:superfamily II DNA or RNA helicase